MITTRDSNSFSSLLNFSIQNPRIYGNTYPTLIVSPTSESHVQHAITCAKKHRIHMRVRSGGHDYEGLSYTSTLGPFILLDLFNLRSISIDVTSNTAWVQSGATLGELYHAISEKAGPNVAFPAGVCPTVGIGGHLSGGGLGTLVRAFGLAADQVVDARLVNANGEIQNRKSMGEGLFWAIRGGGCCFGIILSFKVTLVQVPPNVTVFSASRTLNQGATKLVTKWQNVAHELDRRLFIRVVLVPDEDEEGSKTVKATFNSLFLGSKAELLPLMGVSFPELGLREEDCTEMSWIKSVLYFSGYLSGGKNESALTERGVVDPFFAPFKAKSDFVKEPVSEQGWDNIWKWFSEENEFLIVILDPFGGRMDEISESETPFPHRNGSLYNLQYMVKWDVAEGSELTGKHLNWTKRFYEFMAPYVSKNPRAAYYNYRDLDLGRNEEGANSYLTANVWGRRYFKDNFRRLAEVKSEVDPDNFFRNEQSVPPLFHSGK
ncbi:berberine bridge enzyme-like 22 [Asparagus officinalis]|nr:berberine bridge enzyme-like 22 [Asparagus officinalis]